MATTLHRWLSRTRSRRPKPSVPRKRTGAGSSARGQRGGVEDRLTVDVARRRIAADQIVPVSGEDGAADAARRRPDHLGIMRDIFPLAGTAYCRKQSGLKQRLLIAPHGDELLRRNRAVVGHGEILALTWPRAISAV